MITMPKPEKSNLTPPAARAVRADAQRNIKVLLKAAKAVFATSGVDAPVREIAARAGVGVGTVYRHFPQRSDLVAAVFRREVDACAKAAETLSLEHKPLQALTDWLAGYANFILTQRGLSTALRSGDPAVDALPAYFELHLGRALQSLLNTAAAADEVRATVQASDLLRAVSNLCVPDIAHSKRMISLLIDGLRFMRPAPGASSEQK